MNPTTTEILRVTAYRVVSLRWHGYDITPIVVFCAFAAGAGLFLTLNAQAKWWALGLNLLEEFAVMFIVSGLMTMACGILMVWVLMWGQR